MKKNIWQRISFNCYPGVKILFLGVLLLSVFNICNADTVATVPADGNPAALQQHTHEEQGILAATLSKIPVLKEIPFIKKINSETVAAKIQKNSIFHIFLKGGPIMWPLLLASVLALGTVLERLFFLFNQRRKRDKRAYKEFFNALSAGNLEQALRISNKSKYYVLRALGYALTHRDKSIDSALLYAKEQEMKHFRRGIPMLDTVITLAPLFGLLGTVTGMMGSFSLIGGDVSSPGAVTGGIAEALIATAFGLGIAITSLIPFNFLNTKMENAKLEIESAATQLELMLLARTTSVLAVQRVLPKFVMVEDQFMEEEEEEAALVGC